MRSQKVGFIQVPVMIAIIASLMAVGSLGYIGYEKYSERKEAQNIKTVITQEDNDSDFQEPKLQESELEILKKEINNLKESKQEPPPAKKEPSQTTVVTPEEVITSKPIVSSPAINTTCTDLKNEFATFKGKYDNAKAKTAEIIEIYVETEDSGGLTGTSAFQYHYSQYSAKKDYFFQKVDEAKVLVTDLPTLNKDQNKLVDSIKLNYRSGADLYKNAFNLNLETWKAIAENFSYADIDTAQATLKSANDTAIKGYNAFLAGSKNYTDLKNLYDDLLIRNNCISGLPTSGSVLNIKANVESTITLNKGTACDRFGFSIEDKQICDLYRNYKKYYEWVIISD